ncbi:MAG: hypothetical protein FVQ82_14725 [Planctomycetes bacterium]|nr:hypothetical protein [Planctomycetota bacterium]
MTISDAISLARTAQALVVEGKKGVGSPPSFPPSWTPVWAAKIERIEINRDSTPSKAIIWFPDVRWDQSIGLSYGDMIRIRTDEPNPNHRTVIFVGFFVSILSEFAGGSDQVRSHEHAAFVALDHRWLMAATSPLFGQVARSRDDYTGYGTSSQAPIPGSYTALNGRRTIFNENSKPNRDPDLLDYLSPAKTTLCQISIFADPDVGVPWTALEMIVYVTSPLFNKAYNYIPIDDTSPLSGLDHADWDRVLNHIVVDSLNIIEAVAVICKHLGWGFRLDYGTGGSVNFVFYKVAASLDYMRSASATTILHELYAPYPGDSINVGVSAGEKMLWAMTLSEDISYVVNNPLGIGAPHRFEITAELVPAFLDADLDPDTSSSNDNLFFTEAALQELTDPNSKDYYKYYHPRGDSFKRDVARRWALNEAGRYSDDSAHDRGMPFDFADVIDDKYIRDKAFKRTFAPFNRQLLPCLTMDKDSLNSIGILLEFSFDGGFTWQVIPASVSSLDDECGIYIDEANLAELVDQAEGTISGGTLDGVQLNFWTSLADDIENSRSFKDGDWKTRIRVTASIQLDTRLARQSKPTIGSGSPFLQSQVYDFADKYKIQQRTLSSRLASSSLPSDDVDDTAIFDAHLDAVRTANEDMSISGIFTLERLWLGDGSGEVDFMIGDGIARIAGRQYDLSAAVGKGVVFPEIIKIVYLPESQQTQLITRDLRFAEEVVV